MTSLKPFNVPSVVKEHFYALDGFGSQQESSQALQALQEAQTFQDETKRQLLGLLFRTGVESSFVLPGDQMEHVLLFMQSQGYQDIQITMNDGKKFVPGKTYRMQKIQELQWQVEEVYLENAFLRGNNRPIATIIAREKPEAIVIPDMQDQEVYDAGFFSRSYLLSLSPSDRKTVAQALNASLTPEKSNEQQVELLLQKQYKQAQELLQEVKNKAGVSEISRDTLWFPDGGTADVLIGQYHNLPENPSSDDVVGATKIVLDVAGQIKDRQKAQEENIFFENKQKLLRHMHNDGRALITQYESQFSSIIFDKSIPVNERIFLSKTLSSLFESYDDIIVPNEYYHEFLNQLLQEKKGGINDFRTFVEQKRGQTDVGEKIEKQNLRSTWTQNDVASYQKFVSNGALDMRKMIVGHPLLWDPYKKPKVYQNQQCAEFSLMPLVVFAHENNLDFALNVNNKTIKMSSFKTVYDFLQALNESQTWLSAAQIIDTGLGIFDEVSNNFPVQVHAGDVIGIKHKSKEHGGPSGEHAALVTHTQVVWPNEGIGLMEGSQSDEDFDTKPEHQRRIRNQVYPAGFIGEQKRLGGYGEPPSLGSIPKGVPYTDHDMFAAVVPKTLSGMIEKEEKIVVRRLNIDLVNRLLKK